MLDLRLTLFWHRRDLRLHDNAGLFYSLKEQGHVQPIFIFDTEILELLSDPQDARVTFLHEELQKLKELYRSKGSDLWVLHGKPLDVIRKLAAEHKIQAIYINHDYEPSAIRRDAKVEEFCKKQELEFRSFKDQVIFEKDEVLTDAGKPYTVYTPYKNKWLKSLSPFYLKPYPAEDYLEGLHQTKSASLVPTLQDLGFEKNPQVRFPNPNITPRLLRQYKDHRDFPAQDATSHSGLALRFGTVSVRHWANRARQFSAVWLSELIWREFFMQILFHFPQVEKNSFRPEYEKVEWRKSKSDFEKWSRGETGFPIVDAGMRELNQTGYMHNRVRMITASFLTKQLLIHWRQGEKYFAEKLLDYDLASNNGNWQWVAGTGCDAAPYFRIFNPQAQTERFDPNFDYIRKWVPEFETDRYIKPMVDHPAARDRALRAFAIALKDHKKGGGK
jgi:deoxyribodipyrimidine photo-lyase